MFLTTAQQHSLGGERCRKKHRIASANAFPDRPLEVRLSGSNQVSEVLGRGNTNPIARCQSANYFPGLGFVPKITKTQDFAILRIADTEFLTFYSGRGEKLQLSR